ncbi:MAG: LytR/AlgR family response regulator transcription factor [Lachnospiraceae bacterium]
MFQIAICDDDSYFAAQLENLILTSYPRGELEVEVYLSAESLLKNMKTENQYDLIFLDIEMLGINGVEAGLRIRNELRIETTQIVYVSAREDYYKQLFEVRPNNFLLKPVKTKKVIEEIEKAKRLTDKFSRTFSYKKSYTTYKVKISDILYFESSDKKIRIVTVHGDDTFYDRLTNVCQKLQGTSFLQIHKSYFVNLTHVRTFRYEQLIMTNSDVLAISQSKRKEVRAKQLEMFEEG